MNFMAKWEKQKTIKVEIDELFPDIGKDERRRKQRMVYNMVRMSGYSKEGTLSFMRQHGDL